MYIIIDKHKCENILKNMNYSILNNFKYKKILNDFYNPEEYLFFCSDDGKDVIALVLKNNMVTFYGGVHYNEYNRIANNELLLNETLDYLKNKKLNFRLLSIDNDYFDNLKQENSIFDVPYSPTWVYKDIQNYDKEKLLNSFSGKKRYKINRILKLKEDYEFELLTYNDFKINIELYLKLHIDYFRDRNLESGWIGRERLFYEIMDYFNQYENLFIKIVKKNNEHIGIYVLTFNNKEMIYIFGGTFDKNDENISMLIYFDILENANRISKEFNINDLDAMRGSFGYKKKLNFKPKPLYALVNDQNWIAQLDADIEKDNVIDIYGREFKYLKEENLS